MIIPSPTNTSFNDWASYILELFSGEEISIPTELEWRLFVNNVVSIPKLSGYNIPSASGFDNWIIWAIAFVDAVQ